MEELVENLTSSQKLARDRALESLEVELKSGTLGPGFLDLLPSLTPQLPTEARIGILNTYSSLVLHDYPISSKADNLQREAGELLEDGEARVRTAAGQLLAALCQKQGVGVWEGVRSGLLASLCRNLERCEETGPEAVKLAEKLPGAAEVFHDTAGWNSLETTLNTLLAFAKAIDTTFKDYVDEEMLSLISRCLEHQNRFVRESGFGLVGQFLRCGLDAPQFDTVLRWLAKGLTDNWSQVRMAASTAARVLVETGRVGDLPLDQQALIIPPMCLNRFYLAQGVQIYSQETWRLLRLDDMDYVGAHLGAISEFYVEQSSADNHAVREAAAHAIAELGAKLPPDQLEPYATRLVVALVRAFEDDSWPVRDAACLATAKFLAAFPSIGLQDGPLPIRSTILPKFWRQLTDCIPSVRQGAAESMAAVAKAYELLEPGLVDDIVQWLYFHLPMAKEQEEEDAASSGLSSAPAQFGVARSIRANDPNLHTNQTMYSCGSLAPKMKAGGCSDCTFQREAQPWEESDGAVRLLAQLSLSLPSLKEKLSEMVPVALEAGACDHYVSHVRLKETLCLQIPVLAKGLGGRTFKAHLQDILADLITPSLSCDCRLTEVAGEECLRGLGHQLGPNILRGRIEMLRNPLPLLQVYDSLLPPQILSSP